MCISHYEQRRRGRRPPKRVSASSRFRPCGVAAQASALGELKCSTGTSGGPCAMTARMKRTPQSCASSWAARRWSWPLMRLGLGEGAMPSGWTM